MIYKTRLISGEISKNQKENQTLFKKCKIDVVVNQRNNNTAQKFPSYKVHMYVILHHTAHWRVY